MGGRDLNFFFLRLYFRYTKIFGGSKPTISKFFYTKTIYPLHRKKNFGGSGAPSRPLIAAPLDPVSILKNPKNYWNPNFWKTFKNQSIFVSKPTWLWYHVEIYTKINVKHLFELIQPTSPLILFTTSVYHFKCDNWFWVQQLQKKKSRKQQYRLTS